MHFRYLKRLVFQVNEWRRLCSNSTSKYIQKTSKDIWMADPGTYPILFTIPLSIVFGIFCGIRYLVVSPDVKLIKPKSDFLRGKNSVDKEVYDSNNTEKK